METGYSAAFHQTPTPSPLKKGIPDGSLFEGSRIPSMGGWREDPAHDEDPKSVGRARPADLEGHDGLQELNGP